MQQDTTNNRELVTVLQFVKLYPAFTQGGLRWMIFNAKSNGLNKAILKLGRRVLIDVPAFFEWIRGLQNL